MPTAYDPPLGERFSKASKRAKKNAKRNAKRTLSSLEADEIPKKGISAFENDLKPSQLGGRPDPLTTAVAAENRRDMALDTKSSQSSLEADEIPKQGISAFENDLKPSQLGGRPDPLTTAVAAENRRDMALDTKSSQSSLEADEIPKQGISAFENDLKPSQLGGRPDPLTTAVAAENRRDMALDTKSSQSSLEADEIPKQGISAFENDLKPSQLGGRPGPLTAAVAAENRRDMALDTKSSQSSLEADEIPKQGISAFENDFKPSQLGGRPDPLTTAVAAENRRDMALETKSSQSSLEADEIPKQRISAFENDLKPSQLGGRPDPLTTAVAAENRRYMALETKSSQSSPVAVSGSQREGEWQEIISMPPKENLKMLEYGISSSDSDHAAQEMKRSEYVQNDDAKAVSVTGQDMKLGVSSTGPTPQAPKLFEQAFSEQCSIAPETQAPRSSSNECFQPVAFAAEIVRPPPGTMKPGQPQIIATQNVIKKLKKVRKAPHPNCTKPQVWLADESITMPMPNYPEPWVAPPPPPVEVPKRPVLTDTAKNFLLAQSPNSKITVHLVDDYGFTSFSAPIRGPDGCTLVPEYLVSTATLRAMGFYMGAAEKIWGRYLRNEENRPMEDEYALLFYTQRFIEDTYTDAVVIERVTDSDALMEKWGLVCYLSAAIRREARAKDAANSWRPIIKITDLQHLKAQVTKKVSEKFRALDRLSYEIEKRATQKPVSLTPMGDYVEMKGHGMKFRANQPTEVFAPLARMLDYY